MLKSGAEKFSTVVNALFLQIDVVYLPPSPRPGASPRSADWGSDIIQLYEEQTNRGVWLYVLLSATSALGTGKDDYLHSHDAKCMREEVDVS
ncbi:hypothetical protein RRG08_065227 [Elysia crispata]|uniref:Uncharacterized protein n=1 Tax=Elysia crispata TaxID=231223 RepID=A0AAE0YHR7_9GAST|nr:hypothetical protein RRG08_065227 [Elysia crispata]